MFNLKSATAVYGVYESRGQADRAVESLKRGGFKDDRISILMSSGMSAPEATATGVTSGAIIGGGLGWLAGVGALAIPGVGPFLAVGPIVAALAGAGAGGALGGAAGALMGMGIPEAEAERYDRVLKEGGVLLSVKLEDGEHSEKAREILRASGARNLPFPDSETTVAPAVLAQPTSTASQPLHL